MHTFPRGVLDANRWHNKEPCPRLVPSSWPGITLPPVSYGAFLGPLSSWPSHMLPPVPPHTVCAHLPGICRKARELCPARSQQPQPEFLHVFFPDSPGRTPRIIPFTKASGAIREPGPFNQKQGHMARRVRGKLLQTSHSSRQVPAGARKMPHKTSGWATVLGGAGRTPTRRHPARLASGTSTQDTQEGAPSTMSYSCSRTPGS